MRRRESQWGVCVGTPSVPRQKRRPSTSVPPQQVPSHLAAVCREGGPVTLPHLHSIPCLSHSQPFSLLDGCHHPLEPPLLLRSRLPGACTHGPPPRPAFQDPVPPCPAGSRSPRGTVRGGAFPPRWSGRHGGDLAAAAAGRRPSAVRCQPTVARGGSGTCRSAVAPRDAWSESRAPRARMTVRWAAIAAETTSISLVTDLVCPSAAKFDSSNSSRPRGGGRGRTRLAWSPHGHARQGGPARCRRPRGPVPSRSPLRAAASPLSPAARSGRPGPLRGRCVLPMAMPPSLTAARGGCRVGAWGAAAAATHPPPPSTLPGRRGIGATSGTPPYRGPWLPPLWGRWLPPRAWPDAPA